MNKEEQAIELRRLANLVIDAYLKRDEAFKPKFGDKFEAILCLSQLTPEDQSSTLERHTQPVLNYWYERSEYSDSESLSDVKESE
ncbi:hypothetical protein [Pseudomonas sp.]|uniref:hypothetical protein n=1 Tax=Pseudomonas sp. TaxID=306 RepID=UPI00261088E2|nr:hypothetical protein [Pseudomonas sp.]